MSFDVIVVGAGGFGRETLDVIEAHNRANPGEVISILGVADDNPSKSNIERLTIRGYGYLGKVADAFQRHRGARSIVAVGSPQNRERIATLLRNMRVRTVSVVHPTAAIGSEFRSGAGHVICGGVQISTNVTLGEHVHLNPGAVIGHDTELKDFVSVNPNATVSGECVIGKCVLIGAASVILQGLTVGERCVVGAAACVTKDVSPNIVMIGVPAKPARKR